jgi:hypothetical protein
VNGSVSRYGKVEARNMNSTTDFYKADFASTLFPLKTNLVVIENHAKELSVYIYQRVLNQTLPADSFLPQQKAFATKPKGHLRRTSKLDPVAEYFIYDIVYRNRAAFRPEVSGTRRSFGYRFGGGAPISVHNAYVAYRAALKECHEQFKFSIRFDIAAYFNSLYHHDLTHWFSGLNGVSQGDGAAIGQFFREINAGRSIDFLPHGIYPCKMLGNEFLKFVDLNGTLKAKVIVRFMDDFALFGDDESALRHDFVKIQQLLGQYGLNVNPSKTFYNGHLENVDEKLSGIQQSLKEIVIDEVEVPSGSGVVIEEIPIQITKKLNADQVNSLLAILRNEALEESDADKILAFLRSNSDDLLSHLPGLLSRFPNLVKHVYTVCGGVKNKAGLTTIVRDHVKSQEEHLEYSLFWLACLLEAHAAGAGPYGEALISVYERSAAFKLVRAKVLEIPEQGFGLKEIRNDFLKTGQSDWLSWASAVGTRTLQGAERNYALSYFSKCSPMNHLIAECIMKM